MNTFDEVVSCYQAVGGAYLYVSPKHYEIIKDKISFAKLTRWRFALKDFESNPKYKVFVLPIENYNDLAPQALCLETDGAFSLVAGPMELKITHRDKHIHYVQVITWKAGCIL